MKELGRKMYITWGNYVVAIEKLVRVTPEEMGLSEDSPTKLVDVLEVFGEKVEKDVEGTYQKGFGRELNDYLTATEMWVTEEEFKKMNE